MHCPNQSCNSTVLVTVEKNGIHIDRCDGCQGVWLDRGELEKLLAIARAQEQEAQVMSAEDEEMGMSGRRNAREQESPVLSILEMFIP